MGEDHVSHESFLGAPEGMSLVDFRRHPVREAIRGAAVFGRRGVPSKHDLDALKLSEATRQRVADAAATAARINGTGNQSAAWAEGDRRAAQIIGSLDAGLRDPSYLDPPPEPDPTNPRELAQRVSRGI